eukprot:RCo033985
MTRQSAEVQRIWEVFRKFDSDGNQTLCVDELRRAFLMLGIKLTMEEAAKLMKVADKDGNNVLDFEEFKELFKEEYLRNTFRQIDTDGDGTICISELREGFRRVGIRISESNLARAMRVADTNGDNLVDFEEFKSVFHDLPMADANKVA